jgi:hypothetical protein
VGELKRLVFRKKDLSALLQRDGRDFNSPLDIWVQRFFSFQPPPLRLAQRLSPYRGGSGVTRPSGELKSGVRTIAFATGQKSSA